MKNNISSILIIFLMNVSSYARITDNQIKLKIEKKTLNIEPKLGFHLNAEAPANITFDGFEALYKPTKKTEKIFSYRIVDQAKKAKISLYVCDDKKTVCEQQQLDVTLANLETSSALASPGMFYTDSTESPAEESKKQLLISKNGKPTLLIFSAPWCPACIRMQTEVYQTARVAQQLKKVNFLKLNSDLPENYDLSEKFHVKAIPTLILLNTSGEEVFRWLDFQPAKSFAKSLDAEVKKIATTKDSLEKRAALGDSDAISMVGQLYYKALDFPQAVKWLSMSKNSEDQKLKLAAEVSSAQDASEKDESSMKAYLQSLEKAIVLTSSSMDQTRWLVDWIEKKKELKQVNSDVKSKAQALLKVIEAKIKNQKQLILDFKQSTFGEVTGFEVAEANLMKSRLYDVLDQKLEKEKSDQKIIESLKNRKFNVEKPGEALIGIAYLREGGEKERVDQLYNELIKKFSTTYVYYEKYSRFLLKEKNLDKSLKNAELAVSYAEGNLPQLFLLKARILKEMNQQDKVLETVNAASQLKDIQHVRFKKTLAQLNKLKDEVMIK